MTARELQGQPFTEEERVELRKLAARMTELERLVERSEALARIADREAKIDRIIEERDAVGWLAGVLKSIGVFVRALILMISAVVATVYGFLQVRGLWQ